MRKIQEKIDFGFVSGEGKDAYGNSANVSIPPVILRVRLLLILYYNVRSRRELMDILPWRSDWTGSLEYDLDSEVPNHSVLGKAGARWRKIWRVQIQEYLIAAT